MSFAKQRRKIPVLLLALIWAVLQPLIYPNARAELLSNSGCFNMLMLQCNVYTFLQAMLTSIKLPEACVSSRGTLSQLLTTSISSVGNGLLLHSPRQDCTWLAAVR